MRRLLCLFGFHDWEFHKSVLFYEHGNEMAGENYSGWVWSEDDGCIQDPEYWCEMPPPPNNHNREGA